jgi:hypothetical protein
LDSQRRGPLDNRVPVFGVRRDGSYGSLAGYDNPIFSHIFVAIAVTGEPAIAGGLCCARNMDYRPLNVDIQFEFLWRRAFSAGCLAVFCFRHTIVSVVYISDVRLRRYILRSASYDIAASYPRELPLQRSSTPVTVADPLRSPNSAVLSRMVDFSDCGSHIPITPFERSRWRGGRYACSTARVMLRLGVLNDFIRFRLIFGNCREFCRLQAKIDSHPIGPRPPQTPASSFKRLYRTRAEHLA